MRTSCDEQGKRNSMRPLFGISISGHPALSQQTWQKQKLIVTMMIMFRQKYPLYGQTRSVTANLFWSYENFRFGDFDTLDMPIQDFGCSLFIILSPSSLFISSLIAFFTCDKGNIIRGKSTCGRTTMGDIWRHSEPQVNKQCRHRLRYCTGTRSCTVHSA